MPDCYRAMGFAMCSENPVPAKAPEEPECSGNCDTLNVFDAFVLNRADLISLAKVELARSAERNRIAAPSFAGIPTWEIFLHAFIAGQERHELNLSALSEAIHSSRDLTRRYARIMEGDGSLHLGMAGRGDCSVAITSQGHAAMIKYLRDHHG